MRITHLERRLLRYQGMPARDVARIERLPVERVLEIWQDLRRRGAMPALPGIEPGEQQLTLEQLEDLMTSNRAPRHEQQ